MKNRTTAAVLLLLALSAGSHTDSFATSQRSKPRADSLAEYAGRYGRGATDILYFMNRGGKLTVRPAFWHSIQVVELERDSFVVAERRSRGGSFIRNFGGQIIAVRLVGLSPAPMRYDRLKQTGKLPLELLFDGKGKEAFKKLSVLCGYKELLETGKTFFEHFPARSRVAVDYMEEFADRFKDSSDVYTLLGRAYVAVQLRVPGVESFLRAYTLNSNSKSAASYLTRLQVLPISPAIGEARWKVPFSLNDLFKSPSSTEIDEVRHQWTNRTLTPVEPKEVTQAQLRFGAVDVRVRIVSHRVHGFLHYGAIIAPVHAQTSSYPVIIEAKGVSWNYFPLDINDGLNTPAILGDDLSRVVLVVPSFRGEKLILNGQGFLSEGDRTDNWDGSTDDVLALLNVALQTTPEADSERICAFGRSRGGSVAMLAAIRDRRIKGVVEWAGPTEWFRLMSDEGWTQQELVEAGLRNHAKPNETAGQFIERFLSKAIDGTWKLADVRLKMLASSPLYFASSLPALQIHHGVEDYNVPIANARALADSLRKRNPAGPGFEAFLYEGFGHDTDVQIAAERSKKFLLEQLKSAR